MLVGRFVAGLRVVALGGLSALVAADADAGPSIAFSTLHSFHAGSDGATPTAGLIFDPAGALYGTTVLGGTSSHGTVFKLTPPTASGAAWTESVLYNFTGRDDGGTPAGGVIFDASGALYGTTENGGSGGGGTVFMLSPPATQGGPWTESVLYNFCSQASCADGSNPYAGLIFDGSGALYGTTASGGANNNGMVFKLSPGAPWTETVLYSFCLQPSCADGSSPHASLIFDAGGALYGTTESGGAHGDGTVFKLSPGAPWTESVLYSFAGGSDGAEPTAGLIFDAAGALYGTTETGGNAGNIGTIFMLTPPAAQGTWTASVLHTFSGNPDGSFPEGGLIFDAAGTLYGTTNEGGTSSLGTVFKLIPPATPGGIWSESVLHNFTGGVDGSHLDSGLIFDAAGALYGTTSLFGGSNSQGTVFELIQFPQLVYAKGADFNGDGKGDILWRYSDGTLAIWEMNGGAILASLSPGQVANDWQIVGTGDFNGDGKTDLLWRCVDATSIACTDGTVVIWLMNGATIQSSIDLGVIPTGWSVAGTGDFNGDGTTDILWRCTDTSSAACPDGQLAMWLMNGAALLSSLSPGQVPPLWAIVGIGDFNGDSKADILWRCVDTTSTACPDGQLAIWLMNGAALLSSLSPGQVPDAWQVAGTGDFNDDGKADILWLCTDATSVACPNGTVAIWEMNGGTILSSTSPGQVPAGWRIAGTADFNGDGTTDILWQFTDGTLAIWEMAGGAILASLGPGQVPTAWAVLE